MCNVAAYMHFPLLYAYIFPLYDDTLHSSPSFECIIHDYPENYPKFF